MGVRQEHIAGSLSLEADLGGIRRIYGLLGERQSLEKCCIYTFTPAQLPPPAAFRPGICQAPVTSGVSPSICKLCRVYLPHRGTAVHYTPYQ